MKLARSLVPFLALSLAWHTVIFAQFQQTSGPEGGVINAMVNHNGTLLTGSSGAGIFRSTDGGNTWNTSNTGLQSLDIYAFAEKDSVIFAGSAQGLYRSTDDGVSWSYDGLSFRVSSILICGNYKYAGNTGSGVYRSDLTGSNWVGKNAGLTDLSVTSLTCYDSVIYAGTSYNGEVFVSANHGSSWTLSYGPNGWPVNSLAVSQDEIFAGTTGGGVIRASAGSNFWTVSGNGIPMGECIMALKQNGGVMYAGSGITGVYRSADNGNTWTLHSAGIFKKIVLSLECLGTVPMAGTGGGGVFSFNDSGNQWIPGNSGMINTSVKILLPRGSGVYCGTNESGIFFSDDNGDTWNPRSTGLPPAAVPALLQSGQNLFCGLLNGYGIYKSADQGQTWSYSGLATDVYSLSEVPGKLLAGTRDGVCASADNGNSWGAPGSGIPSFSYVMALLPAGTGVYAGLYDNGVYFSADLGNTWTARNTGLAGIHVNALVMNASYLFAGTSTGVFRSSDEGNHWTQVDYDLPPGAVLSMAIVAGGIQAGTENGLYLSKDNGDSWSYAGYGLTDPEVTAVAVLNDVVFAGTNRNGVWKEQLSVVLGMKEKERLHGFTFYPNPAHDQVTVKTPGFAAGILSIENITGRQVITRPITGAMTQIDISTLPAGVYFVKLTVEQTVQAGKFVKH